MNIGQNIREAREKEGLLVSELARRAGLTISGVTSIETGRVHNPSVDTVVKIARALGVAPGGLLKEEAAPKVVALPSTPLADTAIEIHDEWLRSAGSADAVDSRLHDLEAEARDLEEFIPRYVTPKIDRARLFAAAYRDRWVKLADKRRRPEFNQFKSVSEVAEELGGRYKSISEGAIEASEQSEIKEMPGRAEEPQGPIPSEANGASG